MIRAVLLDVDGTLVDSNDAHAWAWVRAFAEHGIDVPFEGVRRLIGMGGDKLMPRVSRLSEDSDEGREVAERRRELFKQDYLPQLRPFRGAAELVEALKARGFTTVAASSAKKDELKRLLALARVHTLLDAQTSSDDAEESKPDPDIIAAALRQAGVAPGEAILIGDTPYDIEAARRAGVATIAFRCGGWNDHELTGAAAVFDGPWDLLAQLDEAPLVGRPHVSAKGES